MKKYLAALLLLLLFSPQIHGAIRNYDRPGYLSLEFTKHAVPTGSTISRTFSDISGYSTIDFIITTPSSITTANVSWLDSTGVTVSSYVLTSGKPVTSFKSSIVNVTIPNNTSGTINPTGAIYVAQRDYVPLRTPKSTTVNISVGTTASSVTVTNQTAGFWVLQTDAKVYINLKGNTATTNNIFLLANGLMDTQQFFVSGNVISFLSDSGTANVFGEIYE